MRARAAPRGPRKLVALVAAAAVVFGLSAVIAPLVSADTAGACITEADLGLEATPSTEEPGVITLTWTPVDCSEETTDVTGITYELAQGSDQPAADSEDWESADGTKSGTTWTKKLTGLAKGDSHTFWLRVKGSITTPLPDECDKDEDGELILDEDGNPTNCTPSAPEVDHYVSAEPSTASAVAPLEQTGVPELEFFERTEGGFTFKVTNVDVFSDRTRFEAQSSTSPGSAEVTSASGQTELSMTLTGETSGTVSTVTVRALEPDHVYSDYSAGLQGQALYDAVPPTLKVIERTDDGFVADITNLKTYWPDNPLPLPMDSAGTDFDPVFYTDTAITVDKTSGGGAISCNGLTADAPCHFGRIVVTGLAAGQTATVTVSVSDHNHVPAASSVTSQAKYDGDVLTPELEIVNDSRTASGFKVTIKNYTDFAISGNYGDDDVEHSQSYYTDRVITATVTGKSGSNPKVSCGPGGAAAKSTCNGADITVSGLSNGGEAAVTVTVTSKNHSDSSSRIDGRALYIPQVPEFGNVTRTADGFTVRINNVELFRKAPYPATAIVTAVVTKPNGGTEPPEGARLQCDGTTNPGPSDSFDCTTSGTILVTGLEPGSKADVLVTVRSDNHPEAAARITGQALGKAVPVTLGEVVAGKGFIRTQIKDIDDKATYTVTTDAGTALITDGWVNVTGLQPGQTANVTVTAKRPTFADGQAKTTGAALRGAPSITVGTIIPRDGGFSVPITDYDATATYEAMVEGGGTATVEGASGRVTGLKTGDAATLTLTVSREGYESATATAAYRMPADAGTDANFTGGAWPPQVEELAAGLGAVTRNGAPVKSTTKVAKKKATVRWNGMTYTAAHVIDGKAQKTRQKELYVPWGGEVKVDVKGFAPDSRVQVWIFSTPILLGTFTTGATSRGQLTVQMPPYLEAGDHTLVVSGVNTAGELVTMATGLTLQAPTVTDGGDDADRSTETIPPASGGSDNAAGSNNSAGSSSGSAGSGGAAGSSDGGRVVGVQKSKDGALANTGTRTFPELRLALILILLGVGLVVATRRRSIDDARASAPRSVARAVTPPVGAIRLRNPGAERSGRPAQPVKRSRFRRPAAPPRVPVTGLDNLGPGNPLPNVSTVAPTLKGWVDAVSGGRTALTPPRHRTQASVRVPPRAVSPQQRPVPAEVRRIADLLADPER